MDSTPPRPLAAGEDLTNAPSLAEEDMLANLKHDINEFLYPRVPSSLMMGEFDDLSGRIWEMIDNLWDHRGTED